MKATLTIAAIILLHPIFAFAKGESKNDPESFFGALIFILIIGIVIWFVTKKDRDKRKNSPQFDLPKAQIQDSSVQEEANRHSDKIPDGYIRCPFCFKNTRKVKKQKYKGLAIFLLLGSIFFFLLIFITPNIISILILMIALPAFVVGVILNGKYDVNCECCDMKIA